MSECKCDCSSNSKTVVFLACSGGSNVGQITNEVAKKMDVEGKGKFFCLAGVGGHISGMIASVNGADDVVVLDGCTVACAKKIMENADINDYHYIVVTNLGIEKAHDFNISDCELNLVTEECYKLINAKMERSNDEKSMENSNCCDSGSSSDCCCSC
ncbi:MAG: putative zinc-binding protein [Armatimonadota bacterium]